MLTVADPKQFQLQAKLFRGFSDPSRLSILEALRAGPLAVTEIIQATGLTQSNVSNHLGCLRDCGLVTVKNQGRYAYYTLSDDRVNYLLQLADELLADAAKGVDACTRYTLPLGVAGEQAANN
jgi:DNA-binding transcriptional ArsR family regulator